MGSNNKIKHLNLMKESLDINYGDRNRARSVYSSAPGDA